VIARPPISPSGPVYAYTPAELCRALAGVRHRPFRFQNDTKSDTILKRRLKSLLLLVWQSEGCVRPTSPSGSLPSWSRPLLLLMNYVDAANLDLQRLLECSMVVASAEVQAANGHLTGEAHSVAV